MPFLFDTFNMTSFNTLIILNEIQSLHALIAAVEVHGDVFHVGGFIIEHFVKTEIRTMYRNFHSCIYIIHGRKKSLFFFIKLKSFHNRVSYLLKVVL